MHWLTGGKFQRPKHIRYIGEKLATVAEGNKRFLIKVSVRHGKSWLGSHALPTWFLELFPSKTVGFATYKANFSAKWGRRVRNTIQQNPDKLGVRVANDAGSANSWETTEGGGMHTAGVGGEFTGRGFDLLIVDDPVKNAEEAFSETYREKVYEWWNTTARTRVEPGGSIVVIMACWHEEDLAGRLESDMELGEGDDWVVIRIPAVAEENDELGREPGEPLWRERYDSPALMNLKRTVGSYTWAALYQQRPAPAEGNKFKRKWFGRFFVKGQGLELVGTDGAGNVDVPIQYKFTTTDPALSKKASADYTVIATWAWLGPQYGLALLDIKRGRWEAPEVEAEILGVYKSSGAHFMGVEEAGAGKIYCDRLQRSGVRLKRLKAEVDKVTRSITAQVMAENGQIWLPFRAGWVEDYLQEIEVFPNGANDDQVDTTSYAVICVGNSGPARGTAARGTW